MEELQKIKKEIMAMEREHLGVQAMLGKTEPPFTQDILNERMFSKFQA